LEGKKTELGRRENGVKEKKRSGMKGGEEKQSF